MAFSEDDGVDMADSSEENWDDDDDAIDTTESDQDFYLAIKPQSSQSFCEYDFKTAPYHNGEMKASEFPKDILRKVDMKIKDVAKSHVLPILPAKSLMKFRAVSKEWNQWIASPLLAYQQSFSFQKLSGYFFQRVDDQFDPNPSIGFMSLDRSANGVPSPSLDFLPERVKVLSCSSGLLLCQGWDSYYVCNPATKDWKMLPPPQYYHGSDPAVVLAFDPQCNIESFYQVIAAVPLLGNPVVCFEIYSSESDSWSCSSSDCLELENSTSLEGGGSYIKGVAYWNTSSNEVLAFDVKNEIPAVLNMPDQSEGEGGALTLIGDEVCYVTAYNDSGDVFVIDIYGGMDMSLKRSVSVNLGSKKPRTDQVCRIPNDPCSLVCCEILPCIDSDTVVIHTDEKIYFYHLKGQKVETVVSPGPVDYNKRFLPYINSLAMVHA
ncbi:F-box protein At3g26010-like [Nicotiana tabacum]|uniref:F-box protein At3g26010-like n=3 Tax=Nicotiana TaxID=4085 RepID=A0A1S3XJH9_TOBAC|nr:PREDICTED: uncharacterized protein LOC104245614 [Nicotiana sylvestris]XP_016440076.1 PREDICTED: uncharacterized protein LOC107765892 [Nicotiana tabacum]